MDLSIIGGTAGVPRDMYAALQKAHGSHKGAEKVLAKHGISPVGTHHPGNSTEGVARAAEHGGVHVVGPSTAGSRFSSMSTVELRRTLREQHGIAHEGRSRGDMIRLLESKSPHPGSQADVRARGFAADREKEAQRAAEKVRRDAAAAAHPDRAHFDDVARISRQREREKAQLGLKGAEAAAFDRETFQRINEVKARYAARKRDAAVGAARRRPRVSSAEVGNRLSELTKPPTNADQGRALSASELNGLADQLDANRGKFGERSQEPLHAVIGYLRQGNAEAVINHAVRLDSTEAWHGRGSGSATRGAVTNLISAMRRHQRATGTLPKPA